MEDLLCRNEGKTLEFKRDLSSPQNVLRTLVAFANTAGGTVLIGVEDATRAVLGIRDPRREEERLCNLVNDGIAPRLLPEIDVVSWRGSHLLRAEVYPSPSRPHSIIKEGVERGVYVRVGSTNRRADAALLAELRRSVLQQSFDEQPLLELNSEAIDFRAASELFLPYRKLKRGDRQTLHWLVRSQRRLVPTVGGVLLFGKERGALFSDAWIQCGRFSGTSKSRIIDQHEIREHLPVVVEEAFGFVKKHAMQAMVVNGLRHEKRWSVPLGAIREAIINAVVHCDYSQQGAPIRVCIFDDRIEIENPGLLPVGLTMEDIRHGVSKLRNKVIGRTFKELGLIEEWGSGIGRMIDECSQMGLPQPVFEEPGIRFRVTIATVPNEQVNLSNPDLRVLSLLRERGALGTKALAKALGQTTRALRSRLRSLEERGFVVAIGKGPRDPKRVYAVSGGGAE